METNSDEWSASSTDAIEISLVVPFEGGSKPLHSFKPTTTSSIFGEDETISGYQGLRINIRYNACDMRPGLQIMYKKKTKTANDRNTLNLKDVLESYLPRSAFDKTAIFDAAIQDSSYTSWKPPGDLWKTIQSGNQTYEVWKGNLADLAVQKTVKRIQILVSFFIEGGTPIELKEPEWSLRRWTVFFLYHKKKVCPNVPPYIFMGYSTIYQYFFVEPARVPSKVETLNFNLPFQHLSLSLLPCRSRISQFIILPPFQSGGNGSRFYNAIFDYYLKDNQTVELTVEDPNEAFDDMRDLNDLARLRMIPEFVKIKLNSSLTVSKNSEIPREIVNTSALEDLRKSIKIAPRQFNRVFEMQLLSQLSSPQNDLKTGDPSKNEPKSNRHDYRLWKLLVKSRLFHHNRDSLIQLDYADRIEKLEQTLWNVENDYQRLLKAYDKRSSPKVVESLHPVVDHKRLSSDEVVEDNHVNKKAKI